MSAPDPFLNGDDPVIEAAAQALEQYVGLSWDAASKGKRGMRRAMVRPVVTAALEAMVATVAERLYALDEEWRGTGGWDSWSELGDLQRSEYATRAQRMLRLGEDR